MPFGPGTYGPQAGGGSGLAGQALAQQGISEDVLPTAVPDAEAVSEILQMLRGGQVGAEKFMQLLSLLAGSTLGQQQGGPQGAPRQDPRQQRQQGPAMGGGAPPSIAQLLGG